MLKNKFVMILLTVLFAITFMNGCTKIPPGYVGIKVDLLGSQKGVNELPVLTGLQFYNPATTDILEYPVHMQTAIWTAAKDEGSPTNEEMSFSAEGLVITADVSMSYLIRSEAAPGFYVKFRNNDLNKFTHGYLRNVVRDALNEESTRYTVEELYGNKKEVFLKNVKARLEAKLSPIGINVDQFGFLGVMRLPENVVEAINGKIKAIQLSQKTENELRQTEAEAKKQIAQAEGEAKSRIARAEGEAKSNLILSNSLTQNVMDWQRMQLQRDAIAKWDGGVPTYVGGNQSPIPFINVGPGGAK